MYTTVFRFVDKYNKEIKTGFVNNRSIYKKREEPAVRCILTKIQK